MASYGPKLPPYNFWISLNPFDWNFENFPFFKSGGPIYIIL